VRVSSWAGRQLDGFGLAIPPPATPISKNEDGPVSHPSPNDEDHVVPASAQLSSLG